ncbi:MAG TPA: biopolymer transporter ExbD, partial [Saprospiraceae bacterium]|nr:biopolymer transporter ExbD [Saprospiraceae bacterium]
MARRSLPEINAGSMADIAFLLLIFFLVATTMEVDGGISRKLPQKQPPQDIKIKEKNVLQISINRNDRLLVEGKQIINDVKEIKQIAIDFIDNGGGVGNNDVGACDYCKGNKDPNSSDHPNKAIISLKSDRGTSYGAFIAVHDVLGQAYMDLRNRVCKERYGVSFESLLKQQKSDKSDKLKEKIKKIKALYP